MRFGIQAKLVTTLVFAGMFPLIISLMVVLAAAERIRTASVGASFRDAAGQGANQLSMMLAAQVELVQLVGNLPGTVEFLRRANDVPPPSTTQIEQIEQRWPELGPDDPPLDSILHNPLADRWHSVQIHQRRFAEVIVTDVHGRLVAATNKTSDYFQADEPWWRQCYADGKGRLFLADIAWDESAISMRDASRTGALVATLCVPVYDEETGDVIGVMKIALDAGWMVHHLAQMSAGESSMHRQTWLVQGDGKMVPDGVAAPIDTIPAELMQQARHYGAGWTRRSGIAGRELLGFAAVEMPRANLSTDNVQWYVLVAASRRLMLGPVYRMLMTILGVGIAVIVLCFLGGLWIARREVVRPLMRLSYGTGELEKGNISYRLPAPAPGQSNESFRDDELGELARDFNRMADVLTGNVEQLKKAAEIKQQFIDLASHELRTPVTYIVGASDLARRQSDGDTVMEKIHAKAQRLSRIVDNMFKLIGSGVFEADPERVPIDLPAMLQSVCRELDPFLSQRRQRWEIRVDGNLPALSADAEKIHDVLWNLLSNAIRFSPDGQAVEVSLSHANGQIEIRVSDHGTGISPADLPQVFEPFFTGQASQVMRHTSGDYAHMSRGIGLGLSVVKRFVELHGGTVGVRSSSGGSEFTVRLPAMIAEHVLPAGDAFAEEI